jgi:hypothetical protein
MEVSSWARAEGMGRRERFGQRERNKLVGICILQFELVVLTSSKMAGLAEERVKTRWAMKVMGSATAMVMTIITITK